LTADCVRGSG